MIKSDAKTSLEKASAERDQVKQQLVETCAQVGAMAQLVLERLRKKAKKGHPLRLVRAK